MSSGEIVHIAEVPLDDASGMGRIACRWRDAFERRGYTFTHFGVDEVGPVNHRSRWTAKAFQMASAGRKPVLYLMHEPGAGVALGAGCPVAVFSHGIERRWRNPPWLSARDKVRRSVTWLLWRWRQYQTDRAMRRAKLLLVSNREDAAYCRAIYGRSDAEVVVFRNGVFPYAEAAPGGEVDRILFIGTWIPRKGIEYLRVAVTKLTPRFPHVQWVFAGTGVPTEAILAEFPASLRGRITVQPSFAPQEEAALLHSASLFAFPTFAEGQSLALLQAMQAGLCCITSNCCGQKDVVVHRESGLLFEPGDAAGFLALIDEALRNREWARTLGRNARMSVEARTWEAVADEVVDVIESNALSRPTALSHPKGWR